MLILGGNTKTAFLDESFDSHPLDDSDEFGDDSMTLYSPVKGQNVPATATTKVLAAALTTADAAPVWRMAFSLLV